MYALPWQRHPIRMMILLIGVKLYFWCISPLGSPASTQLCWMSPRKVCYLPNKPMSTGNNSDSKVSLEPGQLNFAFGNTHVYGMVSLIFDIAEYYVEAYFMIISCCMLQIVAWICIEILKKSIYQMRFIDSISYILWYREGKQKSHYIYFPLAFKG